MSSWKCVKCGNEELEKDQLQATGGNFSKVFNVQNKKFITISCTKCGYTELYKEETFEKLFRKLYTDEEEIKRKVNAMYEYYSPENEKKYGVVGIKINLLAII